MKTLAAFLAAGGILLTGEITFAQRDATEKMNGEAFEVFPSAEQNSQDWTYAAPRVEESEVKTSDRQDDQNAEPSSREEKSQNDRDAQPNN
jgi:hypothetical protein